MWPKMQLTPAEAKYNSKYEDPRRTQQRVLRRMYYNEMNLSASLRQDSVSFQISRRSRVFGLTAAGDVQAFLVELIDTSGEQYTAGPVHLTNLVGGWATDARSDDGIAGSDLTATLQVVIAPVNTGLFVQEPNIVLAPNQTLNLNVTPVDPSDLTSSFRVGITLHVYEFPGAPGSPL